MRWLKYIATIVSLVLVLTTVVAGVMETRVRVGVLETDVNKLECTQQKVDDKFDAIKDSLHTIIVEQAVVKQRIEDVVQSLERR